MKRLLSLSILLCLLLSLAACAGRDTVNFYYTRHPLEYVYGASDGVIVSEERKAQGHTDDLTYLLNLYLEGPLDTALLLPLPMDTKLIGHSRFEDTLNITLYGDFEQMKDMDFTLASACMAYTCFELTDARQIAIRYSARLMESRTVTITRDALLLVDDTETTAPSETTP